MRGTKSTKNFGGKNDRNQTKISFFFKPKDEEKAEKEKVFAKFKSVVDLNDFSDSKDEDKDDDDVIPPTPRRPLSSNTFNKKLSPPLLMFPSVATCSSSMVLSPDFISPTQKNSFSPEFIPPTPASSKQVKRSIIRKGNDSDEGLEPSDVMKGSKTDSLLRSRSLRLQVKRKLVDDDDFQLSKQIRPLTAKRNGSKLKESAQFSTSSPPPPPPDSFSDFESLLSSNKTCLDTSSSVSRLRSSSSFSSDIPSPPPLLSYCSNVPDSINLPVDRSSSSSSRLHLTSRTLSFSSSVPRNLSLAPPPPPRSLPSSPLKSPPLSLSNPTEDSSSVLHLQTCSLPSRLPPLLSYCSNLSISNNPSIDPLSSPPHLRSSTTPLDSISSHSPVVVTTDNDLIVTTQPSCGEPLDIESQNNKVHLAIDTVESEDWNLSDFDNSSFSKTSPKKSSLTSNLGRRFGRHVVTDVQRNTVSVSELVLHLRCEDNSKKERQCILRGYWTDSVVREGDIVNVLADFEDDFRAVIDDNNGILVVNPDLLLSGTSVVSTLFCSRKAVFGEWFRGIDKGNKLMVVGNLIHQLFQDSVVSRFTTEADIRQHLTLVLNRSENILDRYKIRGDCSEECLVKELDPYVKQIHSFLSNHLERKPSLRSRIAEASNRSTNVVITDVHDIEENIWSPRFGLKGKLDLTVEVKIHDLKGFSKKIVPLELKTGRSTFSAEHSGQVTLYSMMSGDRRVDPESGVLLYIKDGRMKVIPADRRSRQGLIQMRNGLTNYLANPIVSSLPKDGLNTTPHDGVRYSLSPLATPLSEQKLCTKCPYLTTCAIHHKMSKGGSELESNHSFNELASQSMTHLTKADLEYFSYWCTCLFLEKTASLAGASDLKNVWVMNADERERQGQCLNNMILVPMDGEINSKEIRVLHRFVRSPKFLKKSERLSDVGVSINQQVVVSIEARNSIALSMGSVLVVTDSSVEIMLDRNLYKVVDYNDVVFRIDVYASSSIITSCLTNVARLMADCKDSENIRKIVVERRPASFRSKMGKDGVLKAKKILRSLNKEQRSAVLKSLMTEDYLLIKGMPGAGKTATIVALISVLNEMGHSVLLTSHTHTAVDNVLIKLEEKGLDFLRLGSATRIDSKLLRYSSELLVGKVKSSEELNELFILKRIVATTCLGINHSLLSGGRRFDYCIVDEASQILQPACLGPLFLCQKFILVGDHHQLPPIVRSNEAKDFGMDESLFSRLDSPLSTVELSLQYRMNSEINRLANCLTYKEALKCATDEVSNNVLKLSNISSPGESNAKWLNDVLSSDVQKSVLLLDTCEVSTSESRDHNGQLYNKVEVDIVATLVALFTQFGLDGNNLGVICPYRNQVSHVITSLKDRRLPSVEVNTVDQYQGRDKDVIVVSFVRSNSYSNSTLPSEILNDKRRINVAITRARKKLILIGNSKTLVRYDPIKTLFDSLTATQRILVPHSLDLNLERIVNESDQRIIRLDEI